MPRSPAPSAKKEDAFEDQDEGLPPAEEHEEKTRVTAERPKLTGFIERTKGAFTGRSTTTVVWIGRIVVAENGRAVIEITVDGRSLDWTVTPDAVAIFEDGGVSTDVALDAARTTRDGRYEPGTVVRLVLQIPAEFDASSLQYVVIGHIHVEIR